MIAFAVEPWEAIKAEIWPLWQLHYDEIAENKDAIPLDPDWAKYDILASIGQLHIVTARKDERLVGYMFTIVATHIHYRKTLFAQSDLYFLLPQFRGGRTAYRMFRFHDQEMAREGVVKMMSNTKLAHDHSRLFQALGWREAERIFVKVPGE